MRKSEKGINDLFERHKFKVYKSKCDLCNKKISNDYVVERLDCSWWCKDCFIEKAGGVND